MTQHKLKELKNKLKELEKYDNGWKEGKNFCKKHGQQKISTGLYSGYLNQRCRLCASELESIKSKISKIEHDNAISVLSEKIGDDGVKALLKIMEIEYVEEEKVAD